MNLHSGKLQINRQLSIPLGEINLSAIRSQGAGGQNVNKVASAIHLRFDIKASSLPDSCKARLLALQDQRITRDGVVVIKAQRFRTQTRNREDALARLLELLREASHVQKRRVATKPGRGAREKRLRKKGINSKNKQLRKTPGLE